MGKIHALLCAAIASACASSAPVALARGTKCALKNANPALKSGKTAAAFQNRTRMAYDGANARTRAAPEAHQLRDATLPSRTRMAADVQLPERAVRCDSAQTFLFTKIAKDSCMAR